MWTGCAGASGGYLAATPAGLETLGTCPTFTPPALPPLLATAGHQHSHTAPLNGWHIDDKMMGIRDVVTASFAEDQILLDIEHMNVSVVICR